MKEKCPSKNIVLRQERTVDDLVNEILPQIARDLEDVNVEIEKMTIDIDCDQFLVRGFRIRSHIGKLSGAIAILAILAASVNLYLLLLIATK